jgi:hypothetical protein
MNSLLARLVRLTLLVTPLLCFGVSPKIGPDLVGVPPQSTFRVIRGGTLAADRLVGAKLDHVRSVKTLEKGGHER